MCTPFMELFYINGNVFVFNVEDWVTIRKTYRIVGTLSGSINTIQTLPLKLLPEEGLLLLDKGIAKIIERTTTTESENEKEKYFKLENELLEGEKQAYRNIRKRQLEVMIKDIVQAKRKRGDLRTTDEIFSEELEKSTQITTQNMIYPIPLTSIHSTENKEISRERILETTNVLKYKVFKDLWEKGYFITAGFKFGADFLVYLGDPIAYHSVFIVHCVQSPEGALHAPEIVTFSRLATAVKKRAVLAALKEDKIVYITINWIDS